MVHALTEIQRTLRPGGLLIDLRPVRAPRQLEVIRDGGSLFVGDFDVLEGEDPDDEAAHAAVRCVVQDGLFLRERDGSFKFSFYWDSVDEMMEYGEARWSSVSLSTAVQERARRLMRMGDDCRLRTHITMIITRLVKAA
jgi:hypothetical protein